MSKTGSDSNSGSHWTQALKTVQKGLDTASALVSQGICPAVEVWVAAGAYTPTHLTGPTDPGTATFQLLANVALYGGFAGGESSRAERDAGAHVTILTGDLGTPDDPTDNSYHVVTGITGATLDGFTITGGNANGSSRSSASIYHSSATDRGGGMYNESSSPTVANCIFTNNESADQCGAGMYNIGDSSPTVTNCIFEKNTGGGICNYRRCSPTVTNCVFANNAGSGMENADLSSPTVTNCTFTSNAESGMFNVSRCSPTVTNCTFTSNTYGAVSLGCAGMYCGDHSTPILTNCILWGNGSGGKDSEIYDETCPEYCAPPLVVSYSIIQGGYPGTHIINADPLFVDAAAGDLHLKAGSPAIDASNGCASHVTLTDQGGNSRWDIGSVPNAVDSLDIGAFEYQGTAGTDTRVSALCCP